MYKTWNQGLVVQNYVISPWVFFIFSWKRWRYFKVRKFDFENISRLYKSLVKSSVAIIMLWTTGLRLRSNARLYNIIFHSKNFSHLDSNQGLHKMKFSSGFNLYKDSLNKQSLYQKKQNKLMKTIMSWENLSEGIWIYPDILCHF